MAVMQLVPSPSMERFLSRDFPRLIHALERIAESLEDGGDKVGGTCTIGSEQYAENNFKKDIEKPFTETG